MNSHMDVWLETMIKRWHRDQTVERVLRAEISSLGAENQGYLSQMWRVSFDFILNSGDRATKRFIVKKRGSSEFAKVWEVKYGIFRREVHVYTSLLKKMENLMSQFGDPKGRMWSCLYGYDPSDALIFDDLTAKGYDTVDRRVLMDLEESLLAAANLARFHGLGLILLNQGAVDRNEFGIAIWHYEGIRFPFLIDPLKDMSDAIRTSWGSDWSKIAEKIKGKICELPQQIDELLNSENSKMSVINHGDFKTSNLLMKRDWRGRPMKCKLLDFQCTSYHTFTCDLHFFMITSVQPDVRRNDYNKLIEAYHCGLTETLKFYEYPSNLIPSLPQVEEEMKRCSLIGFLFIPLAASFSLDRKERHNFDSSLTETAREEKWYDPEIYRYEVFKDWFAQDIFNFIEKGVLC